MRSLALSFRGYSTKAHAGELRQQIAAHPIKSFSPQIKLVLTAIPNTDVEAFAHIASNSHCGGKHSVVNRRYKSFSMMLEHSPSSTRRLREPSRSPWLLRPPHRLEPQRNSRNFSLLKLVLWSTVQKPKSPTLPQQDSESLASSHSFPPHNSLISLVYAPR